MKQYWDIKKKYPHAFVFFRLGDFYEMFDEDARQASPILGLTLTKRNDVAMCGVPYHASSKYIAKLLKEGKKVAICEQMEVPGESKSRLVERKVVRVITAGTVMEDELLNSQLSNHLLCVNTGSLCWAAACVEVSTGDFWATEQDHGDNFHRLSGLITRINPSEIITDEKTLKELKRRNIIDSNRAVTILPCHATHTLPENWVDTRLVRKDKKLALQCAITACSYIEANEPHLKGLLIPDYREDDKYLCLDENAIKTLELVESDYGGKNQTLWGVLNNCLTSMGSRLLRQWILHPLMDATEIKKRQDCVGAILDEDKRSKLCKTLKKVADIERIVTRITAKSASPRDIGGLRDSLDVLDNLNRWLENSGISKITEEMSPVYEELGKIYDLLSRAIALELPNKIGEGSKVIKTGYDKELDELRSVKQKGDSKLQQLQELEKKHTNIPSLKVGYNSVFGYYIEVTKPHLPKVPYRYMRKQTLLNCERFITEELKELESKILGAEDRIFRLESYLFESIRTRLAESARALKIFAKCVAELDVYASLAYCAVKKGYVKPHIHTGRNIIIQKGRHPIVEHNMQAGEFVPNDLNFDDNSQIMIITGPNMSGKSVYLRQNALIVMMAQVGSFVPAQKADIAIVDRIMTRIGARDILSKGDSTFMVEMKETANILDCATSKSLVLLDEIGRGTSTFDGVSIAWAVGEFLYDLKKGPRVLFATHYFELTELARKYRGIKNFNFKVEETPTSEGKNELVFLHRVDEGPSDKSYGIHVAELAGINPSCILRARQILKDLEGKLSDNEKEQNSKLPLFERHPVLEEIADCKPEKLTPTQALKIISQWRSRL